MGLAKSLGQETSFISIYDFELLSLEMSKTKALIQTLYCIIGIRIKEEAEIDELTSSV